MHRRQPVNTDYGAPVERGRVLEVQDGKATVASYDRDGLVTKPLPMRCAAEKGDAVFYCEFEDGSGMVLERLDGVEKEQAGQTAINPAELMRAMIDVVYPVGMVMEIYSAAYNPNTAIPGTAWERCMKGRVAVGVSEANAKFDAAGKQYGAETHALTENENGKHGHSITFYGSGDVQGPQTIGMTGPYGGGQFIGFSRTIAALAESTGKIEEAGLGSAHNNIQPSEAVYKWRRTA